MSTNGLWAVAKFWLGLVVGVGLIAGIIMITSAFPGTTVITIIALAAFAVSAGVYHDNR